MPVSGVDIEAANKRKAEHIEKESAGAGSESTPQQGTNASAGTQQGAISASTGPAAATAASGAASGGSLTSSSMLSPKPIYLLNQMQVKDVLGMNLDKARALATAMGIDTDSKTKPMLQEEIIRFCGTCDSVKAFDCNKMEFEFDVLKKQDFQQPIAQPPSA